MQMWMGGKDAVWKEIADLRLRPAVDDELGDDVQVGSGTDFVSDAGREDGEDGGGTLAADIEPGE